MPTVKIQLCKNGPILVTGAFTLVDHDGAAVPSPKETVIALCRCGGSATKPFCDGTHNRNGFCGDVASTQD